MSREVYSVFLIYTEEHLESGLQVLRPFLNRVFPGHRQRLVIVDNSLKSPTDREITPDTHQISGDNWNREFSGWEAGLQWLEKNRQVADDTPVVLANDTFHRSYGREYLDLFQPKPIQAAMKAARLAGYVDAFPQEIELWGLKTRDWVRTSLVLTPMKNMRRLRPLGVTASDAEIFSEDWEQFFRIPSALSENYRTFLKTWLFGDFVENSEFKEAWHSQRKLTPESFEFFKGKTRAILGEQKLSAQAKSMGISLFDVRNPRPRSLYQRLFGL